jgi:hypothetical protein
MNDQQYYMPQQPNVGNNAQGFVNLPPEPIFTTVVQFKSLSFTQGTGQYSHRQNLNLNFTLLDYVDPMTGKNMFAYGGLAFVTEFQKTIKDFLTGSKSKHAKVTETLILMAPNGQLAQHLPVVAIPGIVSQLVGHKFSATIQRTQSSDGTRNVLTIHSLQPYQQPQAAPVAQQPQQGYQPQYGQTYQPAQPQTSYAQPQVLPQHPVNPSQGMAPANNANSSTVNGVAPIYQNTLPDTTPF